MNIYGIIFHMSRSAAADQTLARNCKSGHALEFLQGFTTTMVELIPQFRFDPSGKRVFLLQLHLLDDAPLVGATHYSRNLRRNAVVYDATAQVMVVDETVHARINLLRHKDGEAKTTKQPLQRATPLRALFIADIHQLSSERKVGDTHTSAACNQLPQLPLALRYQVRPIPQ